MNRRSGWLGVVAAALFTPAPASGPAAVVPAPLISQPDLLARLDAGCTRLLHLEGDWLAWESAQRPVERPASGP